MNDVSQNILEKIQKEHIKPTPKWHFMLKKSVIWALFAVSLILGSIAFSIILLQINDVEWDLYEKAGGLLGFVFLVIPYFWIIFIIGFLLLGYYNFKHTDTGYKYNTFYVVLISIGTSMLLGTALYSFGISEHLEDKFLENIPFYKEMNFGKRQMWVMEERGLLGGKVIEIKNADEFDMEDFRGKLWLIKVENEQPLNLLPKPFKPNFKPKPGDLVKVIGEKESEYVFRAFDVRPWRKVETFIRIQF